MKKDLMVKLKPTFQKTIFQKAQQHFGNCAKAAQYLHVNYSSLRGYKNCYFKSVPVSLLEKLIRLGLCSKEDLNNNILLTYNKNEQTNRVLYQGRTRRHVILKEFKKNIPSIALITKKNTIDFEKWFSSYIHLINFGARHFNYVKKEREFIEVSYTTHSRKEKREFVLRFPKELKIDEEFMYFFGLWCGDKAGGKRFGVCNQENNILTFTQYFLEKNFQNVEKILYIQKGLNTPEISYDKKYVIDKGDVNGWVLSVHAVNGIFSSFFHYLRDNLDYLLTIGSAPAFFAGLFDAEGNVSLYNKSFRWACKNDELVAVYSKHLRTLNLYSGYDGGCIITYERDLFYRKIFVFLKHNKKINLTNLLCHGKGQLPKIYLQALMYIASTPKMTVNDIAKALKKNKIHSELALLTEWGLIHRESYPYRFSITNKGKKIIPGGT